MLTLIGRILRPLLYEKIHIGSSNKHHKNVCHIFGSVGESLDSDPQRIGMVLFLVSNGWNLKGDFVTSPKIIRLIFLTTGFQIYGRVRLDTLHAIARQAFRSALGPDHSIWGRRRLRSGGRFCPSVLSFVHQQRRPFNGRRLLCQVINHQGGRQKYSCPIFYITHTVVCLKMWSDHAL